MRFIAKYRRYKITARQEVKNNFGDGKSQIVRHGVICEFQHHGEQPHEREFARQLLKMNGTTLEADDQTPYDPYIGIESRLSAFDTDAPGLVKQWSAWDAQEGNPDGTIKREVEEFLLGYQARGRDYIFVEELKLPAPWPTYDMIEGAKAADTIASRVSELGFDPYAVLAYERQERNRPDVIGAVEALLAPASPDEDLVAA